MKNDILSSKRFKSPGEDITLTDVDIHWWTGDVDGHPWPRVSWLLHDCETDYEKETHYFGNRDLVLGIQETVVGTLSPLHWTMERLSYFRV